MRLSLTPGVQNPWFCSPTYASPPRIAGSAKGVRWRPRSSRQGHPGAMAPGTHDLRRRDSQEHNPFSIDLDQAVFSVCPRAGGNGISLSTGICVNFLSYENTTRPPRALPRLNRLTSATLTPARFRATRKTSTRRHPRRRIRNQSTSFLCHPRWLRLHLNFNLPVRTRGAWPSSTQKDRSTEW